MIPYFQFTTVQIGPLHVYVWGLMVALGILVGSIVAAHLAKSRGQDPKLIWDVASLATLAGIVLGRLFHVVFYDPATYIANPTELFALWDGGMSFTGSLIGAVAATVVFLKKKKVDLAAYFDTVAYAAPLAYGIGRIGCFLIHDHPGTLTHFILGVRYPDGTIRHDLGLYEALNGFGMFLLFLILRKRGVKAPTYGIVFLLWYGLARFCLDFLRTNDVRYSGLTPAQYLAMAMFLVGGVFAFKQWKGLFSRPS